MPIILTYWCLPNITDIRIFNGTHFQIKPNKWAHFGFFNCEIKLSDGNAWNIYRFNINVTNSAPRFFNGGLKSLIRVKLGDILEY